MMEIAEYKSIQEHTKFLVFHMQQIFNVSHLEQDCTLQCKDGSTVASSLVLGAMSPLLCGFLRETFSRNEDPIVLLPEVELGEVLLFLKYLFSVKVKKMYSKEDVNVLQKVCDYLSISTDLMESRAQLDGSKYSQFQVDSKEAPLETNINACGSEEFGKENLFERRSDEDGFPCEYCKTAGLLVYFPRKLLLTKHLMSKHAEECKQSNQLLQCDYCGDIFMTKGGLVKHLRNSHEDIKSNVFLKKIDLNKRKQLKQVEKSTIECFSCKEEIKFPMMRDHIRKMHPEKEFNCLHCQMQCFNKETLEVHIQEHKGQIELYNACDSCDALFLSKYQLLNHKKTHQDAVSQLKCNYCDKLFIGRATLEKHEQKHQEGKAYISGRFISQDNFNCDTCDKSFKNRYNLDRHVKSHLGIKSYKCKDCGNSFVDSTRLKQHMWIHAEYKAFKCELCDKEFRHKSHLKSHVSSFHPTVAVKENSSFKCNICDKIFPYQYKLNNHMTWHAAQEQLTTGSEMNNLKSAVYVCSICQEAFNNIDTLSKHCEIKHNENDATTFNSVLEINSQTLDGLSLIQDGSYANQEEQLIFNFSSNIHVGDTMHIDQHGFVQVAASEHNGMHLDDLNEKGLVAIEVANQNEPQHLEISRHNSELANVQFEENKQGGSDHLVIIKM